MNPEDFRVVDISGKRHKMDWLIDNFGYVNARQIIFNALDEMSCLGTSEVRFTNLGIRIVKR